MTGVPVGRGQEEGGSIESKNIRSSYVLYGAPRTLRMEFIRFQQ